MRLLLLLPLCASLAFADSYGTALPGVPGTYITNVMAQLDAGLVQMTNLLNNISNYSVSISNYSRGVSNITSGINSYSQAVSNNANNVSAAVVTTSNNVVNTAAAINTTSNIVNSVTNSVVVLTNYPLNTVFTNGSRPIIYYLNAYLRKVPVSGNARLTVYTDWVGSGVYTQKYCLSLSSTNSGTDNTTNVMSMDCLIPPNARFFSTNESSGSGNSAVVVFGLRQQL